MNSQPAPAHDEADARIAEATRRTRELITDGYPIRFMSGQLALVFIIIVAGILAAIASPMRDQFSTTLFAMTFLVGLVFAGVSYAMAKRKRQLTPANIGLLGQPHLDPLSDEQRTYLLAQLRNSQPIDLNFTELIIALAELYRRNSSGSILSIIGMILAFFCLTGFVFGVWAIVGGLIVVTLVIVISGLERRRWTAVERRLDLL